MATQEQIYANRIFLNAALPLAKVIAQDRPKLGGKFKGKNCILQVSALDEAGKVGTHFIITNGEWETKKGLSEKKPDIELEFKSIHDLNEFFAGHSKKLPKIKGLKNIGLLISFLMVLLKMASLLQAKDAPKDVADQELLVKLYFYLLSSGISQLNKAGHPEISDWAKKSPDRVYAFEVEGKPELSAYVRVKAGNSRSGRGEYTRSSPFFTLAFDSVLSALGTLLQKDDMIAATAQGKLIMKGAPEFGAQLGAFMMVIAKYAK